MDPLIMGWRFRMWSVQTSLRTCALEEMESERPPSTRIQVMSE